MGSADLLLPNLRGCLTHGLSGFGRNDDQGPRRTVRLARLGAFFGDERGVERAADDKSAQQLMPDS